MKIRVTKKGPAQFFISISHTAKGEPQKKIRRTFKGSKADAEAHAQRLADQLLGGTIAGRRSEDVAALWPGFFADHVEGGGFSPATVKAWIDFNRIYLDPEFGACKVATITAKRVRQWIRKQREAGYKPGGINYRLRQLKCFLRWSHEHGHISTMPDFKLLRVQRNAEIYTREQIAAILETAYEYAVRDAHAQAQPGKVKKCEDSSWLQWGAMAYLLATTGLRKGELIALFCECVCLTRSEAYPHGYVLIRRSHFRGRILEETKGKEPRTLPLLKRGNDLLRLMMESHPTGRGPLFFRLKSAADGSKQVKLQTDASVAHGVGQVARAAGVIDPRAGQHAGRSTHKFRHSLLTALAGGGVALPIVQAVAGHKKLSTTQQYLHLTGGADLVTDIEHAIGERQEKGKARKNREIQQASPLNS